MGNILCGPTNNTSNLENIVEPVKEEEVVLQNEEPIKEEVVLQNEEPKKEEEVVIKEEPIKEEPIKEPVLQEERVLQEEPVLEEHLDESVGSDASSTTSSVNDTTPLVTNEKLNEEPIKKKRGRKKKAN